MCGDSGIEVGELAAYAGARGPSANVAGGKAAMASSSRWWCVAARGQQGGRVTRDERGQHLAVVGVQPLPVGVGEERHRPVGLGEVPRRLHHARRTAASARARAARSGSRGSPGGRRAGRPRAPPGRAGRGRARACVWSAWPAAATATASTVFSSTPRAVYSSSSSERDSRATVYAPRMCCSTRPSPMRIFSDSRTGITLMPSAVATSSSGMALPGRRVARRGSRGAARRGPPAGSGGRPAA